MNLPGVGQRRTLLAILSIGVVLVGLSAVVDSAVTDAAPELFAGVVVLSVAAAILRASGPHSRTFQLSGIALAVGGTLAVYTGLATLALVPEIPEVERIGDGAFLVGFVLFAYDRRLWERLRPA